MKATINSGEMTPIEIALGEYGYIKQGDDTVILDRKAAREISDMLAVWSATQARFVDGEAG